MDPLTDPALEAASDAYHTIANQGQYGTPGLAFEAPPNTPYPGLVNKGPDESKPAPADDHQDDLSAAAAAAAAQLSEHQESPSVTSSTIPRKRKSRASAPPPEAANDPDYNPRKGPKVGQACDRCRINKMRCGRDISSEEEDCGGCQKANLHCTYERTPRKRGPIRGHVKELGERVKELEQQITANGGSPGPEAEDDAKPGDQQQPDFSMLPPVRDPRAPPPMQMSVAEEYADLQNFTPSYFANSVPAHDRYFNLANTAPMSGLPALSALTSSSATNHSLLAAAALPPLHESISVQMQKEAASARQASASTDAQDTVQRGIQGAERLLDLLKQAAAHQNTGSAARDTPRSMVPTPDRDPLQHLAEAATGLGGLNHQRATVTNGENEADQQQVVTMIERVNGELKAVADGILLSVRTGVVKEMPRGS